MGKHSKYAPSASHRWINCPGSIKAIEQALELGVIAKDRSGPAAMEGTCAHKVFELSLKHDCDPFLYLDSKLEDVYVDREMCEEITKCIAIVKSEAIEKADAWFTEKRFRTLKKVFLVDVGGTVDLVVIIGNMLWVIDLKYGKQNYVSEVDNSQLRIYGLAGYHKFIKQYKIRKVRMSILQPRVMNQKGVFRHETIRAKTLVQWGEEVVRPAIEDAESDNPTLCAGPWCDWCPVAAHCKENATHSLELAKQDFGSMIKVDEPTFPLPAGMNPKQLSTVLLNKAKIEAWLKAVHEYTQDLVVRGHLQLDDFKIVNKNRTRVYAEPEKVVRTALRRRRVPEEVFLTDPPFKSPKQLEDALKDFWKDTDKVKKFMEDHTQKLDGGVTMVPLTDKRKAVDPTPQADFADNRLAKPTSQGKARTRKSRK